MRDNFRVNAMLAIPKTQRILQPAERYRVNLLVESTDPVAAAFRRIGVPRRYRDEQLVQQRGDSAAHALIVVAGRLRTLIPTADGTEQLIRWMEPGEVSGLSSVLANMPVPVDLVASGSTEVLLLPRQALLELLASNGEACMAVARLLSLRVSELFDVIATQATSTLSARVWATVQRLAQENGECAADGRVVLRLSQGDLANAVGASRQRVNEELRLLQKAGKVRLGYRSLEVAGPR